MYWKQSLECLSKEFNSDALCEALKFTEEMRKKQRDGEDVRFVCFVGENPNQVGHPGVDVTGPDYNWKKRRE